MNHPWTRPPTITPNYGTTKVSLLPKTNLTQVLLHENVSQHQLLQARITLISSQQQRMRCLLDMHRKSFMQCQAAKQLQRRPHTTNVRSRRLDSKDQSGSCRVGDGYDMMRAGLSGINIADSRGVIPRANIADSMGVTPRVNIADSRGATPRTMKDMSLEKAKYDRQSKSAYPALITPCDRRGTSYSYSQRPVTFHGSGSDPRPMRTRASADPRFVNLERSLIKSERPLDGFIQLSPSGCDVMDRHRHLLGVQTTRMIDVNRLVLEPQPMVTSSHREQPVTPDDYDRRERCQSSDSLWE